MRMMYLPGIKGYPIYYGLGLLSRDMPSDYVAYLLD
jgi:hypothetical protein